MDAATFETCLYRQIERVEDVLSSKASEYADDTDRLHNFKVAASLKGETSRQALAGMMVKHTVSVYDMALSDKSFSLAQWDEKITDHINYLILLRAVVLDEQKATKNDQENN